MLSPTIKIAGALGALYGLVTLSRGKADPAPAGVASGGNGVTGLADPGTPTGGQIDGGGGHPLNPDGSKWEPGDGANGLPLPGQIIILHDDDKPPLQARAQLESPAGSGAIGNPPAITTNDGHGAVVVEQPGQEDFTEPSQPADCPTCAGVRAVMPARAPVIATTYIRKAPTAVTQSRTIGANMDAFGVVL